MNWSSEKSLTNTSQSDLSLNDIKDRISLRESSNKDTISVSGGKDTVSMIETLPDVTEGSPTKEYILFISETEMDYNRKSWTEEGTMKSSTVVENRTVDDEIILMKKECCPFGTQLYISVLLHMCMSVTHWTDMCEKYGCIHILSFI